MNTSDRQVLFLAVPWLFLILSIVIYTCLILVGHGRAPAHPMDQSFVYVDLHLYHNGTNWIFQYPHLTWSGGITGSLIIGLYKILIPTSVETLNWHVKIFSATLFLTSVFWLARAYKLDQLSQAAALAIVTSSGLLLLEPSTEVLAGAFLNFFAIAIRYHQPIVQALLLAVFSLIKVGLLPVGIVVAAFWTMTSGLPSKARLAFLLAFAVSLAAFVTPAIYLYGHQDFSGKSLEVFTHHYCQLFHPGFKGNCVASYMPDVRTLRDVVWNHTAEYFAFIAAAMKHSLHSTFFTLNLLVFSPALMIRPALMAVKREDRNLARVTLLVVMLTLATTLAFASIRPRFLTRLLGLLLVAGFQGLSDATSQITERTTRWVVIGLTIIIVGGNLLHFDDYLAISNESAGRAPLPSNAATETLLPDGSR